MKAAIVTHGDATPSLFGITIVLIGNPERRRSTRDLNQFIKIDRFCNPF
jgi:hypothetical protein